VQSDDSVENEVQTLISELYERYRPLSGGEVATYIPELARMPPDKFAICLVSAGGKVFEAGDVDQPFTIQSISKPLTFGMAIEACSRSCSPAACTTTQGTGPSGLACRRRAACPVV